MGLRFSPPDCRSGHRPRSLVLSHQAFSHMEHSEEAARQRRKAVMLRAVQDQLESPETPEVRKHYQRLLASGHGDVQAREMIATLLAFYIWHTRRGDDYTYTDYVAELERLPEIDWREDADGDA